MLPSNAASNAAGGAASSSPDPNAAAREYARSVSQDELRQFAEGRYCPYFAYPPDHPVVFVKFGGSDKQAEGDMQRLAFDWLRRERQRDPRSNIYVPEVFNIFTKDDCTYIVMELVTAKPLQEFAATFDPPTWEHSEPRYYSLMAEGVHILSRMPVPKGATPGPFTHAKRRINHLLFKDQTAPVEYPTIQALEDHLNRVAQYAYRSAPQAPKVVLERQLVFCYTDFNHENFMFATDPDGRPRLYIVDFEHASFLPLSFLAYAVSSARWSLCTFVGDRFGASLPWDNIAAMDKIFGMFQISTWYLGLEKRVTRGMVAGVEKDVVVWGL